MKLHRWQKILAVLVLLLGAGALVAYVVLREPPPDTRFTGAYLFEDGRRAYVAPREGEVLRYRLEDGTSGALYPAGPDGDLRYVSGPGWSGREPVELEVAFRLDAAGRPEGFTWQRVGRPAGERAGAVLEARRLDLPEEVFTFPSGDLALRGKLVLPPGAGPHPAVVLVHGSESYSAVDHYFMPYLFAAHGVATLAYDKRGTGGSEGEYTQNFHVLARDVAAAVEALRARPDIDPELVHLQGGSQGGWIAPLAASHLEEGGGGVRSLLIGYGPMVSIVGEDRWGYVYELRRQGYGEEAIARADEISEAAGAVLDYGEWDRWDDLMALLAEAEGEPWFEAAAGSDSTVGFLADTWMPGWAMKLYARWRLRPVDGEPFADRLYDPVPVVAGLDVPSLWIFGGEDSSMPTAWSVAELERLQAAGRPIEVLVYPEAEHGILRFEEGEGGERRYLGYEPEYLMTMVRWLRERSGLEAAPSVGEEPAAQTLRSSTSSEVRP